MTICTLPFGSEFSPSQIELPEILQIVEDYEGDLPAIEATILATYFANHGGSDPVRGPANRKTLAMNSRLGLQAYGIVDAYGNFTEFGRELGALKANETDLYRRLAKHILLNLHGMTLVQCIQDMVAAGETVSLDTLPKALLERNISYPSGGKHPSMMRLWLAKAGVFVGARWQIDTHRIEAILGINPDEFAVLANFTAEQRAFLRALANTGETKPQSAKQIVQLASATYGIRFPEKSLPKLVLNALERAGYIVATKTTSGRGSKPFLVQPTAKLVTDIVDPLFEQLKSQTDAKLMSLLRKPLSEIIDEMDSEDRYIAGLALEALAFKIMRFLDMTYVATRLRANQTGGAEVDLIFEAARLVFSRWQVQCKNTSRVSLDDVAKEVGLTHFIKSTVIVMVTTGTVGSEARRYANKIMADSNLAIVMIDGADLQAISDNPASIVNAFDREARNAMALKKLEI